MSSRSYLYDEINSVFKIDNSLNETLILSINSFISTLCKIPKGIELINTLIFDSLRCGFQIVLTKGKIFSSSFPIIKDGKLIIEVTIPSEDEIDPDTKVFARLFYNRKKNQYYVKPMTYPLFIILAHEFVHSIHHIKVYELLIEIPNCPPLDAENEIWENFVKDIYKNANINIESKLSSDQYQHYMYKFLLKDIFKKTFGFSIFENKSDDYCVLAYYWNNNKEDESLTIIGDGTFSDNMTLIRTV